VQAGPVAGAGAGQRAIGGDFEWIAPGARFETHAGDEIRLMQAAFIQLIARREFDVADGFSAAFGNPVGCRSARHVAHYHAVAAVHVRHPYFDFKTVGDAAPRRQAGDGAVAPDLAHVGQGIEQGRNDGIAGHRNPLARRIGVLEGRFQHVRAARRQHARLLEQRRDLGRAPVGIRRRHCRRLRAAVVLGLCRARKQRDEAAGEKQGNCMVSHEIDPFAENTSLEIGKKI